MNTNEVVGAASDEPVRPLSQEQKDQIKKAWTKGEKAPVTLYRTATGQLAESVKMDDPHEVVVEAGAKIPANLSYEIRDSVGQDRLRLTILP